MNNIRPLTTISFDGDMTLWDFQKVMRHSLALTLAELRRCVPGKATSALTIDKMIDIRNVVASELKGTTTNLEDIRLHAFERTVEFVGYADNTLAAELNALYLKHRFEDIELYPDVTSTLDALRSGFSLGLISNGNGYPERCGLAGYFSFVVFSQDIGVDKPDPRIFLAACQQASCIPTEVMHVGDSLETDVAGANTVGAMSVWLNRQGKQNNTGITPDYEIRSLAELVAIVEGSSDVLNKPDVSNI